MVEYGEHAAVMSQFDAYLDTAGIISSYRGQLCQRVYHLIGILGGTEPLIECNPRRMVDLQFRKMGWSTKGFYAVACRWFQSFVRDQETGNQRTKTVSEWQGDALMLRFHEYTLSKGRSVLTAREHCRRVYGIAHLPLSEIRIDGYDLRSIVESRYSGASPNLWTRTCLAIRWFDRFLRSEAGLPDAPSYLASTRQVLAIRLPITRRPAPPSPEKLLLTRFDTYLQAHGEPAQYARHICSVLDLIHRSGHTYEVIAGGDAETLVMTYHPGRKIDIKSRIAVIRRFQEFVRASELFGISEELGEGVPA